MKRYLLITLMLVSLTSLANPVVNSHILAPWEQTMAKNKKFVRAFTDPYCDFYIGYISGTWPIQTFNLQATLNQSPGIGVHWLVQIQVFGVWKEAPEGGSYKVFDFTYTGSQWNKTILYQLKAYEEAYPGVMDIIYDGPQ